MRQELFEMTTESGEEICFVVLGTDQCAILRNGDVVETYLADDSGLGRALRRYFDVLEEAGGARHPFQALDGLCEHPHAG
jgi:hypothetical protein